MSTNLLLQQNNKRNTVTIKNATTRPTTNPSMVSKTYIQKFCFESCGKPIVLKLLLTYVNKFLIRFFQNKDLLHLNDIQYNVLAEIFAYLYLEIYLQACCLVVGLRPQEHFSPKYLKQNDFVQYRN